MFAQTKTSDTMEARFNFNDVTVTAVGLVHNGYRDREHDELPDVWVEHLYVGLEEITPWVDYFPGLLEAAEEALIEAAS